jgi:hypothetical protein
VLFERRLREGIDDGAVTVMFRRWRRVQAVAGRRYRTGTAMIEVDSVDAVDPAAITDADARHAGYGGAHELRADLRGDPATPVYRVAFHRLDEPDPRAVLAADDNLTDEHIAEIGRRLDRLDRTSPTGPWTGATLAAIAARPGVRAGDLAASLDRERLSFKQDVRKLKALGLTESLPVGYRLSPRGAAYLAARPDR